MSSTLKELAIALSKKQEHYVDYLTNESPILDNMRFEASTHGLWNAYEEVSKIDGAGFVDINQPLPALAAGINSAAGSSFFSPLSVLRLIIQGL